MQNYEAMFMDLAEDISETAAVKGFWYEEDEEIGDDALIPLKLCLIHSEVSEAMEVHRKEYDDDDEDPLTNMTPMQEEDFFEELADVVIRVLDVVGYFERKDFGEIILSKMEINRDRPKMHSKRY